MRPEIRPMTLGELLETGFQIVRAHARLMIGIGAMLYLPVALFGMALQGSLPDPAHMELANLVPAGTLLLGMLLYISIINPVVQVAMVHALCGIYLGREPTIGECWSRGRSLFMRVVGASLFYSLIVLVGFLLLVVPGIYAAVVLSLYVPILVMEDLAGMASLRRSRELIRGSFWRMVGVSVACMVLTLVLTAVVSSLLSAVPALDPLGEAMAQSAGTAFASAVFVAFYFDLRARSEAFDLERLAATAPAPRSPDAG